MNATCLFERSEQRFDAVAAARKCCIARLSYGYADAGLGRASIPLQVGVTMPQGRHRKLRGLSYVFSLVTALCGVQPGLSQDDKVQSSSGLAGCPSYCL